MKRRTRYGNQAWPAYPPDSTFVGHRAPPRMLPDATQAAAFDEMLAGLPSGEAGGPALDLLDGPDLFLALHSQLANLGAPQAALDELDDAMEADFDAGLEQLKGQLARAIREFDGRQAQASEVLTGLRALGPGQRQQRRRLVIRCDSRAHTLGEVFVTPAGLFIHLKGDSRLLTPATFAYEVELTRVTLVRHGGALLAWDLNPDAYWCTTGCPCESPTAVDFRRVRVAVARRRKTVVAADVAWSTHR